MLGNGDGGLLGDVASGLGCPVLDDKAAESAKIDGFTFNNRSLIASIEASNTA